MIGYEVTKLPNGKIVYICAVCGSAVARPGRHAHQVWHEQQRDETEVAR